MFFRSRPGLGWLWVTCAYLSLVVFLYGVNRSPKHAELLQIEQMLQQGTFPAEAQRTQLFNALSQYPLWSQEWNGSQTHILGSPWPSTHLSSAIFIWRTRKDPLQIRVSEVNPSLTSEVILELHGYSKNAVWHKQKTLSSEQVLTLPATAEVPELVHISTDVSPKTAFELRWDLL